MAFTKAEWAFFLVTDGMQKYELPEHGYPAGSEENELTPRLVPVKY